jgi:hypothetical protein
MLSRSAPVISEDLQKEAIRQIVNEKGEDARLRAEKGVRQVAARWFEEDGEADAFLRFCREYFVTDPARLSGLLKKFDRHLETYFGHSFHIYLAYQWKIQVEDGEISPVDLQFASVDPFAHYVEDFYRAKLAFTVLLNFPLHSLFEKERLGESWPREKWAEVRLAELFQDRIPGSLQQKRAQAYSRADHYVNNYNIFLDRVLGPDRNRLYAAEKRLISHWGLRDEIRALYAQKNALTRQKTIYRIMDRIVRQEIPEAVINSTSYLWDPWENKLFDGDGKRTLRPVSEGGKRYRPLKEIFLAEKEVDAFTPESRTFIDRRFQKGREISEEEMQRLLVSVLESPLLHRVARAIERRLGRKLEPFDIWYNRFGLDHLPEEAELDAIVSRQFPDLEAFRANIPEILKRLGFPDREARRIACHIQVDPARGAGHALGSLMRGDPSRLRTRVPPGGMNYKGFNVAMHELGHNVEQVISLYDMDFYLLHGVPNTAFTEAFAFAFQKRDLEVLGIGSRHRFSDEYDVLNRFWSAFEIAGVALVDMAIWHWLYDHPEARETEISGAVQEIAVDVWNRYFAPVIGVDHQPVLAIYSHIIDSGLYIPDYPLGMIISFQIEHYLKGRNLGEEMLRMCAQGNLSPNLWMKKAVGMPISADPLLEAADRALTVLEREGEI